MSSTLAHGHPGLDQLHVAAGMTLLINGASGGIGSTAVQLAVARGARVIGTASAANHNYRLNRNPSCPPNAVRHHLVGPHMPPHRSPTGLAR